MAENNTAVDYKAIDPASYDATGFAQASGANTLKQAAAEQKIDNASLRQQAEAQYQPTFEAEQAGLKNQLSALIKAQTDDSDLLNRQYQQSVNTMMTKLAKRGLNNGVLPDSTTAALDRFRNEVMTQRQAAYGVQQQGVQNLLDTHAANRELNIQARMFENKSNALSSLNQILTQMAQLQSQSFEDYVSYLLNKRKNQIDTANIDIDRQNIDIQRQSIALDKEGLAVAKQLIKAQYKNSGSGGGGGRSRRRYYGGGGSGGTTGADLNEPTTTVKSSYFAGSGATGAKKQGPYISGGGNKINTRGNMYK